MTGTAVYKQGWSLDDVQWSAFDPAKASPRMVAAIKAAALVELNAPDYVSYLKRVFKDAGAETLSAIEQWGCEESQHGRALGRWAEMADPSYKVEEAFARFRAGYKPEHFDGPEGQSIRGSRRGEQQVEDARGILQAWEDGAGSGVVTYNGRMIENLHVEQAERALALAAAIKELQAA